MAMASLNLRPINHLSDAGLSYRACEAKFSAETAGGVGRSTTGYLINRDGISSPIMPSTLDKFRGVWEKWRMQHPPQEALSLILERPEVKG